MRSFVAWAGTRKADSLTEQFLHFLSQLFAEIYPSTIAVVKTLSKAFFLARSLVMPPDFVNSSNFRQASGNIVHQTLSVSR